MPLPEIQIVIIGPEGVGKTSIVNCLRGLAFGSTEPTIGGAYVSMLVVGPPPNISIVPNNIRTPANHAVAKLAIWDTAGQHRYKSLIPVYIRSAHIAVVVIDPDTPVKDITSWMSFATKNAPRAQLVTLYNKCDMIDPPATPAPEFIAVSAKTKFNIMPTFVQVLNQYISSDTFKIRQAATTIVSSPRTPPTTPALSRWQWLCNI